MLLSAHWRSVLPTLVFEHVSGRVSLIFSDERRLDKDKRWPIFCKTEEYERVAAQFHHAQHEAQTEGRPSRGVDKFRTKQHDALLRSPRQLFIPACAQHGSMPCECCCVAAV